MKNACGSALSALRDINRKEVLDAIRANPVIILIPIFKVMKAMHLLDTYLALIMANTGHLSVARWTIITTAYTPMLC